MKLLLTPSKRLYLLGKQLLQLPIKMVDSFAVYGDELAVVTHKTLTIYRRQQQAGDFSVGADNFKSLYTTTLSKKIQAVIYNARGVYLSDKYGDVFSFIAGQKTFLNENFAIPRLIHWVSSAKDYLLIGDEYCKLKVFNANNMHQLIAVWVPFNAQPLQILTLGKELIYLVRRVAKENTTNAFECYKIDSSKIEEEEFPGTKLPYESEMVNDNLECRLVQTGQQSFAVVCLQTDKVLVDCYHLSGESNKTDRHNRQIIEIARGQWDSLSVTYLQQNKLIVIYGQESELSPPAQVLLASQPLTEKQTLLCVSLPF